jgi:hypothetical protein
MKREWADPFDESKWSSVIIKPSLWWRIKALFRRPTIIFAWGQDRYTLRGFDGETSLSAGGLPTALRDEMVIYKGLPAGDRPTANNAGTAGGASK